MLHDIDCGDDLFNNFCSEKKMKKKNNTSWWLIDPDNQLFNQQYYGGTYMPSIQIQ